MRRLPRLRSERGSVSLVAIALLLVTMVLVVLSVDVFQVLAAKDRAQMAADAAALAAAQELVLPSDRPPAELAAEYAAVNGAHLVSCRCDPGSSDAVVTVERTVTLTFLGESRTVQARARALVGDGL